MLQMKNRLKYCSLAIAAARVFSSGPTKNPVVYLDIAADGEEIGRIIIEVSVHFERTMSCHTNSPQIDVRLD